MSPTSTSGGDAGSSRLLADSQGAILVAGVFMAALLAGALFFLAGVGRAVVQRESLQDGADAVAFTAGVYHARGMNIVALLNVLSSALILVLMGVKLLHSIAYSIRIVSCFFGDEGCTPARSLEDASVAIEQRVFPRVHDMLENAYTSQNALAVGMPWVAVARSAKMAPAAGGPTFGVAVGPSLAGRRTTFLDPYEAEAAVADPTPAVRDVGDWPGLPLVDASTPDDPIADWAAACRRNKPLLDRFVRDVLVRHGIDRETIAYVLRSIEEGGGLCGEGGTQGLFTELAMEAERRTVQRLYRAPKKMAPGVVLGSDAFALWSVVGLHATATAAADRGVERAAHGARPIAPPPAIGDVQVAKAEYYFEPKSAGASWATIEPVALWSLRWRARLRRVRPPTADVREAVARSTALDLAGFASNRQAAATRDGNDAARARAEALRLLDAWFSAGAAGTTAETMNAWLAAQPGVPNAGELSFVH
jgi:hypothetical protein